MTTTAPRPCRPALLATTLLRPGARARIAYRNADGESTERLIEVRSRFRSASGATYLRAWCHLRGEERTFREDRVVAVRTVRAAWNAGATSATARTAGATSADAMPVSPWTPNRLARRERERERGGARPGRLVAILAVVAVALLLPAWRRDTVERLERSELVGMPGATEAVPAGATVGRSIPDPATRSLFASADVDGDGLIVWAEVTLFQRRLLATYGYRTNEHALAASEFVGTRGGDCEDWAIVTVGMLAWWGVHAVVGVVESDSGTHAVALVPVPETPRSVGTFTRVGHDGTSTIYVPIDYGEVGGFSTAVRGPWRLTRVYDAAAIVGRRM